MVTTKSHQTIGTRNYDYDVSFGSSIVGANINNSEISQNDEASPSAIDTAHTNVRGQTISFEQRIEDLKQFKEKHGHCDLRRSSKNYKSLRTWCNNVRSAHNGTGTMKLTPDRIRRLEKIGFKWSHRAPRANEKMSITTVATAAVDPELASNSGAESESASDWSHDRDPDIDDTKRGTPSTIQKKIMYSMTDLEKKQDGISITAHKGKRKTETAILAQRKGMKRHCQIEASSQSDDERKVSNLPGSPAFDPSRYTFEELQDNFEESKRVCSEMERREVARLDEIANRLFQTDDEDSS